ncbi:MAG: XRE family transcriptional regulator [Pseudomonadota bacterium]|jgi:Predicted transcriptional regulators|nr:MAG: XRE family transcriptional regulator [Pseudomonadota bacterium]
MAKRSSAPRGTEAAEADGNLYRLLGLAIRDERRRQGLTIAQIAERTQLSRGMLSKIETGHAAMSLESLSRIAAALGVSLASLFRGVEARGGGAQHIKAGTGMEVVRRGTKRGHTYHLLAYDQGPHKRFEPFLISMDDKSEAFPVFEHPGTEFIYMLQGKLEYRHGKHTYLLEPGDSLTFSGQVPHGPERLLKLPIRFLSIIIYGDPREVID